MNFAISENKPKITPRGFFERFLHRQLKGLTGHIEQAGYPFDREIWGTDIMLEKDGNPAWWVYEQTAYWLDGYVRCGILLDDKDVIERASSIIYSVLNKPDTYGFLGPKFMKETDGWNRWAYVVFFRACMALYEYNDDEKILRALENHYLSCSARHNRFRDVMNVEIMLWLYGKTGNKKLLKLAETDYNDYNRTCIDDNCDRVAMSDKKPFSHGVTYNEYGKLGAILFTYTGKKKYLDASVAAFDKIDKYFMLPSGCLCSDEFTVSDDYMHSYETCDISDYTWSLGYMFDATKNAHYADKLEKCVFNAGMGSVLENFKGLQYFSCANQIIADNRSNHNDFYKGSKWMSYRPNPGTECCPGNVNRFMPNYILNSVKRYGDEVYIALFCDADYEFEDIRIMERTDFPFGESITLDIATEKCFKLKLRIPEWADRYEFTVGGKEVDAKEEDGFVDLEIYSECSVRLSFSSSISKVQTRGGVYFQKGALVYSLGQKGRREVDKLEPRSSAEFPAYNMYPTEKWNYAIDKNAPARFIDGNGRDFDLDQDLPHLEVYAYEAKSQRLLEVNEIEVTTDLYKGVKHTESGHYVFTPPPNGQQEFFDYPTLIKLYPYGACKLRITVFTVISPSAILGDISC
ncbi:MAG: hypothetical protein HDT28_07240 [Clostridiales bacterium]|nr:hypothetical protein [Clostridiales bacterium]